MVSLLAAKSHCFLLAIILAAVGAPFLGTATHSSHGENTLVDGDEDIETLMSTEERSNTSASQRRYALEPPDSRTPCRGSAVALGRFAGQSCERGWQTINNEQGIVRADEWCIAMANAGCELASQASLESTPPPDLSGSDPAVAVLVIGQLRSYFNSPVFDSQRFVTSPLVEEYGKSNVHVFFCIDSPNGPKLNGRQFGGLELAKVFQYSKSAGGQFGRFAKCFGDVRKWTRQAGSWGRYSWFVRTRPDMIFYEPVPATKIVSDGSHRNNDGSPPPARRLDTIYQRSRRIGPGFPWVDNEEVSYFDFPDICSNFPCVHKDTRKPDPAGRCMIVDDQFAYIPKNLAPVYFGPAVGTGASYEGQPSFAVNNYSIPKTHTNCMWPEGELTCKLLRGGARLELLRVHCRLQKWCSSPMYQRHCGANWGLKGPCRGDPFSGKGPPKTMSADHWEKISDTPAQRDVGTTYGDRGCLSNLKDPDPETACGSWCYSLPGCKYFWVYTDSSDTTWNTGLTGRCCTKVSFQADAGFLRLRSEPMKDGRMVFEGGRTAYHGGYYKIVQVRRMTQLDTLGGKHNSEEWRSYHTNWSTNGLNSNEQHPRTVLQPDHR